MIYMIDIGALGKNIQLQCSFYLQGESIAKIIVKFGLITFLSGAK